MDVSEFIITYNVFEFFPTEKTVLFFAKYNLKHKHRSPSIHFSRNGVSMFVLRISMFTFTSNNLNCMLRLCIDRKQLHCHTNL